MSGPSELGERKITVTAADGSRADALLALCLDCRGEQWLCYFIHGHYMHLQCLRCGTSYCLHEGSCAGEASDG